MITYEPGDWGIRFIFRINGSVLPRALVWGATSGLFTVLLHVYTFGMYSVEGVNVLWGGYTTVLGFLVVFRNNEAYARFWDGTALLYQVRGEWLNAGSSLVAFCSAHSERRTEVLQFQEVLMRLLSMLHCSALQMIAEVDDDTFEIISPIGMDPERVQFIMRSDRRTQIAVQWIQRSVVEACRSGVLDVPAPILSRVFQELSRGIVNLHNIRKIKDVPLPFPYAQTISGMMLVHWIITPIIASQAMQSPLIAGVLTLGIQTAFWSIIYIAREIEQPFGDDNNDLPMPSMQVDFNESLELLLQEEVQTAPSYLDIQRSQDALTQRDRCSFGESHMTRAVSLHQLSVKTDLDAPRTSPPHSNAQRQSFLFTRQFSPPSMPSAGQMFGTRRKSNAGSHMAAERNRTPTPTIPGNGRGVSPAFAEALGHAPAAPEHAAPAAPEHAARNASPTFSSYSITGVCPENASPAFTSHTSSVEPPECPGDIQAPYAPNRLQTGSPGQHSFGLGSPDAPSLSLGTGSRRSSPDDLSRVSSGQHRPQQSPSREHIERNVSPSFGSECPTTPRSLRMPDVALSERPRLVSRTLPEEEEQAEVPGAKHSVVEMGCGGALPAGRQARAASGGGARLQPVSETATTAPDHGERAGGQPPTQGSHATFLEAMRKPLPSTAGV